MDSEVKGCFLKLAVSPEHSSFLLINHNVAQSTKSKKLDLKSCKYSKSGFWYWEMLYVYCVDVFLFWYVGGENIFFIFI